MAAIEAAAAKAGVRSGLFFLIGALDKARLGFYAGKADFKPIDIEQQLEITSCIGNLAEDAGQLVVHAHITVADSEGRIYGGHMLTGCRIYIRAELMILQIEGAELKRKIDDATGLQFLQD